MEGLDLLVGEAELLPVLFGRGWVAEGTGGGVEFGVVLNRRWDGGGGYGGVRG